mmetsp:Transcript_14917/g.37199  ORF Transcript_14917/g.37199 Transcript_14917/m.37199 type:complete len:340 (+) Transcript_14917:493-1512(+)
MVTPLRESRCLVSHSIASRSRWLVGSSRSSSSGLWMIEMAIDMRIFQPPESELTNVSLRSLGKLTCTRTSSTTLSELLSSGAFCLRNWRTVTPSSHSTSWRMYHVRRSCGKPLMSFAARRLSRVVFPVPFCPIKPYRWPRSKRMSALRSSTRPANARMMFCMSMAKSLSPDSSRMALAASESIVLNSSTSSCASLATSSAFTSTCGAMLVVIHSVTSPTASTKYCTRTTPPSFSSSIAAVVSATYITTSEPSAGYAAARRAFMWSTSPLCRLRGSTRSPAPSRSFSFAIAEDSRMSGDEWSRFFSRSGRRLGTKGAMSDDSLISAHRLETHTVAFFTSS